MKASNSGVKNTIKVDRFLIPYRIYENKGAHIICINGVQQSMAMWQSFVSRFSSKYRIVLFDFPGQGRAEVFSGSPQATLDEQVQILSAVLEKANVSEEAILCAASWGGVVAVAFAAKYPNRIKKMVLASLGTKPNKKMVETIMQGYTLEIRDRDKMAEVLIKAFGENLPSEFKQRIVTQFRKMKEEDLRAFCEHGLFVISSKKLSDMVDLKKIKAKTILLNGEKDTIIDLDDVKFLATQIPDCEIKIIKGVGHFMHIESVLVLDIYEKILQGLTK